MEKLQLPSVFISADIEGCATLVHWDEVMPGPSAAYARACRIMTGEVNAATRGALAAGARDVVVNDAHSSMRNLVGQDLDQGARLVSGRVKPLYMLEGIESDGPELAFFIGYHGAIGDRDAVMGHTYSPRVIFECRLNGQVVGELTINAALAAYFGVPVALVSGDATTLGEAERNIPWALRVQTKVSMSYFAAQCRSPQAVCDALQEAAADAVRSHERMRCFELARPIVLEIDTMTTSQAGAIGRAAGFARTATRTVSFTSSDMAEVYNALVTLIAVGAAA
ncbi:MAG: M55 family metallopeptidase [Candidatus Eremiobacteraeota bacterium]|nr:M55 family metallopeptidase [Candidatus Eremiobacteraeota bacterium]